MKGFLLRYFGYASLLMFVALLHLGFELLGSYTSSTIMATYDMLTIPQGYGVFVILFSAFMALSIPEAS